MRKKVKTKKTCHLKDLATVVGLSLVDNQLKIIERILNIPCEAINCGKSGG